MALEARLLLGLALAMAIAYAATPVAIRVANRLDFHDLPIGYKGHAVPTPYLGGAAVVAGFVVAMLALSSDAGRTLPVVGGVLALWAVGTLDDRRTVAVWQRLAIEVALAVMLWAAGLGWSLGLGAAVDVVATAFWVVAVVNAFNLFDNMDGASSTMAGVVAAAVAALGLLQSDVWLVATAAALCGACLGFLPHNLSRPAARIFLGDGGSIPIGFAVAALVMIGSASAAAEWQALVMGLLLVGVPALDTCLVVVSRRRRGISILTGGRDHLTHRTQARLRTARASVAALGAAQVVLAALAIVAVEGGAVVLVPAVALYLVAMATVIALLDRGSAEPAAACAAPLATGPPAAPERGGAPAATAPPRPDASVRRPAAAAGAPALPGLAVLAAIGVACGLSPFAGGFYDSSIWAPAGLGLLVVLTAALIAGPQALPWRAIVAPAAIAALALVALASALWTDSIERAVVEGNRLLLYAAALALLVVVLRSDRGAAIAFAAFVAGAVAVGGWVLAGLLGGDASLFLAGRLHEPLGYINAQASFFVLALWPCLALAERRGSALAAGAGLAGATLFAGLAVLGQSRGAVLAALLSLLVVLAVVPGRLRRGAAILALAACLGPALPALLDVYGSGATAGSLRGAGAALLLAGVAAGALWSVLVLVEQRAGGPALRRAAVTGMAVLLVGGLAAGAAGSSRIATFAERQYTAFVTLGGPQGEPTASRLASGAGNRYDYWRVAVGAWRERRLAGVGAGGYVVPYFARRTTAEDIRQPHSLPLQVLVELGLVGALLLAVALGLIAAGAWRRVRAAERAPAVVAGLGVAVAWLVHASVDWMHLLPGLTGIALLGAAVLLRPAGPRRARVRRRAAPLPAALIVGLAIAVAALSLSRQGLSERYVERAQAALAGDPRRALVEANRALRLDRESIAAHYAKAAALARFGDGAAARRALTDAARREPRNFVTWTLRGDLSLRQGNLRAARADYRRAARLNPRDPGLAALAADPRAALRGRGGR